MKKPNATFRRWILSSILLLAAVFAAVQAGWLQGLDHVLLDLRFAAKKRAASGDVVLVQIDARSLNAVGSWPWPRSVHARLIDRLREAGARDIAIDIDFSHPSRQAGEDEALEQALERAQGSVILPAFRQPLVPGDPNSPVTVSRPMPQLAQHSWPAIVNVWPETDGFVRKMERVSILDGDTIASMAQLIAGGSAATSTSFAIDFSIAPASIPRLSASDVLEGRFDVSRVAGKSVIVGATAVELGDRFAVPLHGIISGAEFQVLAAESLLQDRAVRPIGAAALTGSLIAVYVLLWLWVLYPNWRRDLLLVPLGIIAIEIASLVLFNAMALAVSTAPVHLYLIGYLCWRAVNEINLRRLIAQIANTQRDNSDILLGRVLDDSADAVIIVDQDTTIIMSNRAAATLMRDAATNHAEAKLEEGLAAGIAEDALSAFQAAMETGQHDAELATMLGGMKRYVQLTATRSILHGEDGGRVVTLTVRDITERRLASEAIENAAEEAHASNRAKSSFLATVSHELRTPLNAIIGFSDILRGEMFGTLGDARYTEYAEHINQSGSHLLSIVNNILDITRIEAGNLSLNEDEIELSRMFEDMRKTLLALPGGAEKTFVAAVEPAGLEIEADPQVLRQILLNLLSNAAKFTPAKGGRIEMRASLDGHGCICISVSDNGIGIDPSHVPNLTKPFYQVDGRLARQHEGAGLGLALVNGYVQAHGGKLTIDSVPGEGTVMTICLPSARVVASRSAA